MSPHKLLKALEIMSPLEEEQNSQLPISGVFTPSGLMTGHPSLYKNLEIIDSCNNNFFGKSKYALLL